MGQAQLRNRKKVKASPKPALLALGKLAGEIRLQASGHDKRGLYRGRSLAFLGSPLAVLGHLCRSPAGNGNTLEEAATSGTLRRTQGPVWAQTWAVGGGMERALHSLAPGMNGSREEGRCLDTVT